jgi:type 1 fimbriae regulatory protein FimB/type 1 fimbriae regulatory protein FimE
MRWDDADFTNCRITIRRLKREDPFRQPLGRLEQKALRSWKRHQPVKSEYVFTGWTAEALDRKTIWFMMKRVGKLAGFSFSIHPHMLRHSAGYYLGGNSVDLRTIQSFLGHKSINHTMRYVAFDEKRYRGLFKD